MFTRTFTFLLPFPEASQHPTQRKGLDCRPAVNHPLSTVRNIFALVQCMVLKERAWLGKLMGVRVLARNILSNPTGFTCGPRSRVCSPTALNIRCCHPTQLESFQSTIRILLPLPLSGPFMQGACQRA